MYYIIAIVYIIDFYYIKNGKIITLFKHYDTSVSGVEKGCDSAVRTRPEAECRGDIIYQPRDHECHIATVLLPSNWVSRHQIVISLVYLHFVSTIVDECWVIPKGLRGVVPGCPQSLNACCPIR